MMNVLFYYYFIQFFYFVFVFFPFSIHFVNIHFLLIVEFLDFSTVLGDGVELVV